MLPVLVVEGRHEFGVLQPEAGVHDTADVEERQDLGQRDRVEGVALGPGEGDPRLEVRPEVGPHLGAVDQLIPDAPLPFVEEVVVRPRVLEIPAEAPDQFPAASSMNRSRKFARSFA